jgi:mannose-1-phosphate guanylyltransferase
VEQDSTGAILRFVEKPEPEEAPSNRVNAGIYVMEKTALRWIPRGREVSIERETFPMLIEQGAGVYGKTISGYWMDLGTKERYRQAHWDLLNQELRLKLDAEEREPGIWIGRNVRLGNGVLLLPPVLAGDDVTIGDGAVVGPYSVIGKGCKIGKGANILHSIVWSDCRLPDGVRVEDSIVGQGVELEPNGKYVDEVLNRTAEVVGQ